MTGTRTPRLLLAGVAFAVAFVAGCGVRPSDVITGGPAPTVAFAGTRLYLVADGQVTLVLRPGPRSLSPAEALARLVAGPSAEERASGLTSEIPADAGPIRLTSDSSGTSVTVSTDARALSPTAVDQIACTVDDVLATRSDQGAVSLIGQGHRRRLGACPIS